MPKLTKIYGTFGPCCHDTDILQEMLRSGMTGIRLNLSHSSLSQCEEWIHNLWEASHHTHIVPELLVDLQGRELRVGAYEEPIYLTEGTHVDLHHLLLPPALLSVLKPGQQLRLDDGKIQLRVDEPKTPDAGIGSATVLTGGELSSRKSISADGLTLHLPPVSEDDRKNMALFQKYGVTGIMIPFTENPEDLIYIRKLLAEQGLSHIRMFAKIENETGFHHLSSLIPHCDEIIIARGDLGNNLPLIKVPEIQKRISALCRQTKTPFMVVTEMLASMTDHPVPTRAELNDIFNAVLDGASSLMVTGETASGAYPAEVIRYLSDVAFEAQHWKMESSFLPW